MLILEIALGIILACVAMVAGPLVIVGALGVVARVMVAVTKAASSGGQPRKLLLADSGKLRPSSTVLWTVGICIALVIGCFIAAALGVGAAPPPP